jgi:hypothetical protein
MRIISSLVFFTVLLTAGLAWSANDNLGASDSVPVGERVAGYLQTMVTATTQAMLLKPQTKYPNLKLEPIRATIIYNPDEETLDVTLVGSLQDVDAVKEDFNFIRKLILGFNKKLDYYYEVTLTDEDINLEYHNVPQNKTILKYENGLYTTPEKGKEEETPRKKS